MTNYKGPLGSDESEKNDGKEEKIKRVIPEFVFIDQDSQDETQKIGSTPHDPKQLFGSIQNVAKGRQPFYLRIFAFIGTLIMLFLTFIVFIVWLITVIFSLLLFRQSTYMNNQQSIAWKSLKKALVFTLGCFVCIFNLSLGVGIVLMYFMMTGEKLSSRFVQEFTKHR